MNLKFMAYLVAMSLICVCAPVRAKYDASADFRQIQSGETLQILPDRAYLLLRIDTSIGKFSADLLRVPNQAEIELYESALHTAYAKAGKNAGPIETFAFEYNGRPNFFELSPKKPISSGEKMVTVLAEVTPGEYVLYGEGGAGWLYECFCLGTVGFKAEAGSITDLGTMIVDRADKPSVFPELAGETGFGPSAVMDYVLFSAALRPRRLNDNLPEGVDATRVTPAKLHAVGPYIEPNTLLINRLAPIPGVLDYRDGNVIDVATNAEMPAH